MAVHDPKVSELAFELEMEAQNYTIDKENRQIHFFGNDYKKAVEGCTSLVVLTEWDEFKKYDFSELIQIMKAGQNSQSAQKYCIYDFRAYLDVSRIKVAGFDIVFRLG